ncbi:MAG TPA: RNA polymerase sigma-70 factor [Ktedonobacterales bacterium]|nr:RNA polymerase sigma-70 factor [Ktedonobacterales bacterium]
MDEFETYRPLLFSIAYRMLGSASEAEDMVQETYLRFRLAQDDQIHSLKSYLTTIITRLCLDELKSARAQREQYIGPWLPEPLLTDDAGATLEERENVSMAFLVLLEALTPPERAVFLLHEVFDYPYQEIGGIIGKNATNCRQLFHRAQQHLAAREHRFAPLPEAQRELVGRFLLAVQSGDVQALTDVLAQDVVAWSDGGGKVSAALRPVSGQERVIRFIQGLVRKSLADLTISTETINGGPALLFWTGSRLFMAAGFRLDGRQVQEIYGIMNPDKLAYLQRQLQARGLLPPSV